MKLSLARKEFVNVKLKDIIFNGEVWTRCGLLKERRVVSWSTPWR